MNNPFKDFQRNGFTLANTLRWGKNGFDYCSNLFVKFGFTQEDKWPRFKPGGQATYGGSKTTISVLPWMCQ